MKKIISSLFVLAVLIAGNATAENVKEVTVTKQVTEAFSRDFISTSGVTWKQSGEIYIVHFNQFDGSHTAFYTADGELLGAGTDITKEDLPRTVTEKLNRKFEGYSTVQAMKYFSRADGLSWLVLMNGKKNNLVVHLDRDGFINSTRKTK
ncbi:MAG: hypothetical protein SFU87_10725 [Chitinophagaceae bacterium]|nr:hypothetical protein [Chitinophagaceae bacterium]